MLHMYTGEANVVMLPGTAERSPAMFGVWKWHGAATHGMTILGLVKRM